MTLIKVTERVTHFDEAAATLLLPFEQRQKSRMRAFLDTGEEVGLVLARGGMLRHGDLLRAEDGRVIRVEAAAETVSTASAANPLMLARACYHLGNRHVPLQIGQSWVRYPHDHVLDGLVESLGLAVKLEEVPFEPEAGAYPSHGQHTHGD